MKNNLINLIGIDKAWNDRNWKDYTDFLDDDLIAYRSGNSIPHFKETPVTIANKFCDIFPDAFIHTDPYLVLFENAEVNLTCSVARITGTMTGKMNLNYMVIEPNHRCFDVTLAIICRWRDGKIIEKREYFEGGRMLSQLQIRCQ
jgi:SnoaL-like polyketide cyclase